MVLHVAKGSFSSNLARVSFPAEADKIRNEMVAVEDFGGWAPAHIIGGGGAANIAASYIERNALFSEEGVQTQKEADRPAFALTLAAPAGAVRLDLPASDNELERAKVVLRLDDLSGAAIRDVEIGYPLGPPAAQRHHPGGRQRSGPVCPGHVKARTEGVWRGAGGGGAPFFS